MSKYKSSTAGTIAAARVLIASSLDAMKHKLLNASFDFIEKGQALIVSAPAVTIYFDSLGKKFCVLTTKDGREIHENKFLGGVINFIQTLPGAPVTNNQTTTTNQESDTTMKKNSKKSAAKVSSKKSSSKKSVKGESKTVVALVIFKKMYGKKNVARKDVIAAFIKDAKLTKAGAATYYYNFTKQA